jgi:integrase
MVMKQTNQKPSTIPARWQWPIDVTSYDRSIIPSNQERVAIERLMHRSVMDDIRWGKHTYQALERLARPLYDVCGLRNTPTNTRAKLTGRLCIEMSHRKKTFWGWSPDEWKETICVTSADFLQRYGNGTETRQYIAAAAYLLTGLNDVLSLGRLHPISLAMKVFGDTVVNESIKTVHEVLLGWGFTTYFRQNWSNALCYALIVNRSPYPEDLTYELLDTIRNGPVPEYLKTHLPNLSRVLVSRGILRRPLPPRAAKNCDTEPGPLALNDVAPEWARWCQNWRDTSTLSAKTRQTTYYALLIAGRWAARQYPQAFTPEHWTRETAAAYVAAVCRMTVGQFSHHKHINKDQLGKPLTARAKAHLLSALRMFFRDCQAWGQLPCRFDPGRSLATPRSVRACIGPDPRVIADDIWAKLLWAGLNLTIEDLPSCTSRWPESDKSGSWYPLEMFRAVIIVWLFAGLRSDEIRRLRVGSIRWQREGMSETVLDETLTTGATCLLDIPINKTNTAFTKPVDAVVGEAVTAWEKVRPSQPPVIDSKTGEMAHYLFFYRNSYLGKNYLNETLIPMLCRKAGVPEQDARGRITSHRARSTIASQLCNAKEPLSLLELQQWLGHKDPNSTMNYVRSSPTKLAQSYRDAAYFKHNLRTIEVLIDQEAVKSGAAASGEPWKYYDLGHGYCSYDFFEQCPHRMACAKCSFYIAKDSSRTQLLEAKANLQHLLQEIPLREDERAAVEDGLDAVEKLYAKLVDVATPAGQTPREIEKKMRRELPILR